MVATIGFFDGVHRGHQCLIRQVQDEALQRGMRSLIITFDRHPRAVFAPGAVPPLLTTTEEKMALLKATGIDDIYVLPFDKAMAALTAREFMQQVLKEQLGVKVLVIGYDHRFGRRETIDPATKSQGTIQEKDAVEGFAEYQGYGREMGIEVVLAKELEGEHVSSSEIRRALDSGDVQRAAQLLGRSYTWTGRVVHGHEVGRQLGFPTANLVAVDCSAQGDASHMKKGQETVGKMLPARGAYAVRVKSERPPSPLKGSVGSEKWDDERVKSEKWDGERVKSEKWDGEEWDAGMLNIGQRPTIDNGSDISIEAHLFDFEGDLYGQTLTLSFIARLREERRFASEEELMAQLQADKQVALSLQP